MNEILPHLTYQEVIKTCSSSHEYEKLCDQHQMINYIYNKYFKFDDFLAFPENYIERIKLLQALTDINKDIQFDDTNEKLYFNKSYIIKYFNNK